MTEAVKGKAKMKDQQFQYEFERAGGGGEGSKHCTYCPLRPGEACAINCSGNYERVQAERAADGVVVNDAP